MKDYKRLTFKKSKNISSTSYDELLNRLADLEDKIENGTLIGVESTCTEEKFDYICKYYENGLCHLGEELFGTPPQLCNCINDFENCMGSKPIEESKKESKNRMKCKYYSDYESGQYDFGICSHNKCKHNGFPAICTHKDEEGNCTCFEPIEYEKESFPSALKYDKVEKAKLMPDNGRSIDQRTLTIQNCDKVILKPKSLEVEVKIEKDNFDDFDFIKINGHKFKKV